MARVALVAPNSVDWVIAMLGCALAGVAVVPISPFATEHEALHMLSQTRVGVILVPDSVGGHPVGDLRRVAEGFDPAAGRAVNRRFSGNAREAAAKRRATRR